MNSTSNSTQGSMIQDLTHIVEDLINIVKDMEQELKSGNLGGMNVNKAQPPSESPFGGGSGGTSPFGGANGAGGSGSMGGASSAYSPKDIYNGFYQGKEGNCVSVAAIKASMVAFGPNNVFKSTQQTANGVNVTMRDGMQEHLTNSEINQAAQQSNFRGNDGRLVNQANFMFAAMAKRGQMEGINGMRGASFGQALNALDNGENYLVGPHLLGLDQFVKSISPSQIGKYDAAVGASNNHAVFGGDGEFDHYGTEERLNGTDGNGESLNWAYALVK
jgi:hypothetical protein